ncbi:MAG: hypothetical protein OXU61_13820, partial [Gammaproteobacteria bacterium]|nr:hypothetical protein [Gammaproteobacteria bacterium]
MSVRPCRYGPSRSAILNPPFPRGSLCKNSAGIQRIKSTPPFLPFTPPFLPLFKPGASLRLIFPITPPLRESLCGPCGCLYRLPWAVGRWRRFRRSPHRRDFGLAPSSCRLPLKGGVM